MPEGPEIKRSVDFLSKTLVGRRVAEIHAVGGRYALKRPEGMTEFINDMQARTEKLGYRGNTTIQAVTCKGKFTFWSFSNDWSMWCTYGMSGQWSTLHGGKHCAIEFAHGTTKIGVLEDQIPHVFFNDPRHFGTVKFVKGTESLLKKLQTLGFDPFEELPIDAIHITLMKKRHIDKPIGQVLMDQSVFAGVGNYIRAEALYAAKISPFRPCRDLSFVDVARLCDFVKQVMWNSYQSNGATILTYKDADGHAGAYASKFACYGRKTDPLGNEVVRQDTPDGRTIHWCPSIQV